MTKKVLTDKEAFDIIVKHVEKRAYGEVSEWFKEPVLKTGDSERGRGFESHLLRLWYFTILYILILFSWRSTQVAEGAPLERE